MLLRGWLHLSRSLVGNNRLTSLRSSIYPRKIGVETGLVTRQSGGRISDQLFDRSIISFRTIFVASRPKPRKPKASKLDKWAKDDTSRIEKNKEAEYRNKLKELRKLTADVSKMIKKRQDEEQQIRFAQEIPLPSQIDRDTKEVYDAISSSSSLTALPGEKPTHKPNLIDPSSESLLTPVVQIPASIQERLGLSIKFLVLKDNQNWPLVLQTLESGGGFEGLVEKDVRKFIYSIPKTYIPSVIPQLESLLKQANIAISPKILNVFIESLGSKKNISPHELEMIESYVNIIRTSSKNSILPRRTYESLIFIYGKYGNLDKINKLLVEMKENDLQPSPIIYSNILKTLVYKTRNHKEAVSIFDSMKFLSEDFKPNTGAYQDVIVSYINNDNIERALDLYQEMINSKIPFNQEILTALARGCMERDLLKFKAWDFMFDIYDNKWTPTIHTLEYILYLSSKDGDVALSRALYKKLASSGTLTKRAFTFLLMAYSKAKGFQSTNEIPSVALHEKGRNLRGNLLTQMDIPLEVSEPKFNIPFLPVLDLTSKKEIMAESSALWAHTLVFNPDFINIEAYNTYLNVAAEFGTFEEFIDRYDYSKLIDDAPTNTTRLIIDDSELERESYSISNDDAKNNNENLDTISTDKKGLTTSPILKKVEQMNRRVKITRTTLTYIIGLKAAGRFKDYRLAQDIWIERGKYRKSNEFKTLDRKSKDKLDFEFANEMVQSLTKMKLLDDALAIVLSTEYQFKWSWAHLTPLYQECVKVGHDKQCRTLRGIARRAQYRFEGKIKKRDYKEYAIKKSY